MDGPGLASLCVAEWHAIALLACVLLYMLSANLVAYSLGAILVHVF